MYQIEILMPTFEAKLSPAKKRKLQKIPLLCVVGPLVTIPNCARVTLVFVCVSASAQCLYASYSWSLGTALV